MFSVYVAVANRVILRKLKVRSLASFPLGHRLERLDIPANEAGERGYVVFSSDERRRAVKGRFAVARPVTGADRCEKVLVSG